MEVKPETLSIGVIDFFSIFLPGAALTGALMTRLLPAFSHLLPPQYKLSELAQWILFLFASYLLGHFVFLLGALLDELVYDPLRKLGSLLSEKSDLAVNRVRAKKEEHLPDVKGQPVINAFQWAKARLTFQAPLALQEVQRLEADSKFFRSLVVVLLLLSIGVAIFPPIPTEDGLMPKRWQLVTVCLVLCGLSLWRYIERRFKATQQAYWFVITLDLFPPGAKETNGRA